MPFSEDVVKMLANLNPHLHGQTFVFCQADAAAAAQALAQEARGFFVEAEGVTLILEEAAARRCGLTPSPPFCQITLMLHSQLEAVGLTAAVAQALARHGISANVVAAYCHDHIFVPQADGPRALEVLQALQRKCQQRHVRGG